MIYQAISSIWETEACTWFPTETLEFYSRSKEEAYNKLLEWLNVRRFTNATFYLYEIDLDKGNKKRLKTSIGILRRKGALIGNFENIEAASKYVGENVVDNQDYTYE